MTTVFARGQIVEVLSPIVAVPALILAGYFFSPEVSGLFLPSTLNSISPALRVGLIWISFLVGLRYVAFLKSPWRGPAVLRGGAIALVHLSIMIVISYFVLNWLNDRPGFLPFNPTRLELWAMALVLGGVFSSSNMSIAQHMTNHLTRFDQKRLVFGMAGLADMLSVVAIAIGFIVWSAPSGTVFTSNPSYALIIGLVLAVTVRLLIPSGESRSVPARLGLLGLATLGAGAAVALGANEALVGFVFGMALAFFYKKVNIVDSQLKATEWPVQMGIYFILGLHLELHFSVILLGLLLGFLRLGLKYSTLKIFDRNHEKKIPIASVTSFSALGLVFALSIDHTTANDAGFYFFASTFAVAAAVTDFLTVIFWATRESEVVDG